MKIGLLVMAGLVFTQAAAAQTPENPAPPPSAPPARPFNIRSGDTPAKAKNLGGAVVRLGRRLVCESHVPSQFGP